MPNDYLLPRAVKPLPGHKAERPIMMFVLYCECGWRTVPNPARGGAYSDWRRHVLDHGGEFESRDEHVKRENRHRRKLGLEEMR